MKGQETRLASGLAGRRIGLLQGRMTDRVADLFVRQGADVVCAPAVREAAIDAGAEVIAFLDRLTAKDFDIVVGLTGAGIDALFAAAERLGREKELTAGLRQVTVVCRGPKPAGALRRRDVPVAIAAAEPYTTAEILAAMQALDVAGQSIAIIHYGERNAVLADALSERGARLCELCLYEWQLPEDVEPLRALVRQIVDGAIDAVVFTSQVQVRHLFRIAQEIGHEDALRTALATRIVVASIGPTCSATLRRHGITPRLEPERPKLGPLVASLTAHFSAQ